MAAKRTMISQLTSVGEGALGKLTQNPVGQKAVESVLQVKDRVEKLVKSIESLERRMTAAEKRLDALDKRPKRRATVRRKTTTASKD